MTSRPAEARADSTHYIFEAMAYGSSGVKNVPLITDTVLALSPRSVVDLGMGTGKYGYMLREQHDLALMHGGNEPWRLRLVGVEGYAEYVGDVQRLLYDEVVISDVRGYLAETEEHFDVALALDILEHFTPRDGEAFLGAALDHAKHVVVMTPRHYYRQDAHVNPLEHHRSWWPKRALTRAADHLGADATVIRRIGGTTIAVLSREREAEIIALNSDIRDVIIAARDRIVPEIWWSRFRGDTGPMVS